MEKGFVIVKPEGFRFLKQLETTIIQEGYFIEEVFFIHDWGLLARNIYRQDWLNLKSTPADLDAKLWITKFFFGNHGLAMIISKNKQYENDKDFIHYGHKIKKSFRLFSSDQVDNAVIIAINLDSLNFIKLQEYHAANESQFSSKRYSHLNQIISKAGYWTRCRFTLIHAPDPKIENVRREWKILIELGIISDNNRISAKHWEFMKTYQCPILPSELHNDHSILKIDRHAPLN